MPAGGAGGDEERGGAVGGALVIQTDSFANSVFKDSFRNLLSGPEEARSVSLASNAIFEVCPWIQGSGFRV